jgi:hypothetical protein
LRLSFALAILPHKIVGAQSTEGLRIGLHCRRY